MFRMPAEWEPHEGTWLAWPHNEDHWPGNFAPIPRVYAEIIRALVTSEDVFLCVNDADMEEFARMVLKENGITSVVLDRVRFLHIRTDSSWTRDFGPIYVRDPDGNPVITDWIFNSWGGKYPPWDQDDAVPQHAARILQQPLVQPGIVLEGGSIDVNGKGTLLTTEQCLLNQNRNPHLNREQIEDFLRKFLGATNILWLKEGIIGDDTDGHIDDIARFVDPRTVVCVLEENESDENYKILKSNHEALQQMHDQDGSPLNVIPLPMPDPVVYEGNRLPASYANFYIANRVIMVPTFRCRQDQYALATLRNLFPFREVIGIDCVDLVWGLGTLHCSTQQQTLLIK
ncbi:agmatine deiminase family protein [bacterium]|nr:agmatine deiminase family protein [bacterium]MCI0601923.1 agmatine deiminase family protein [bacterium]